MAIIKQYEKKDGAKAWMFQTYLGINPLTGKEVRTTRRNFKTKKEAQIELNRLLVDFEENGLKQDTNETFQEIYELWYESYKTTVKEVTQLKIEIKFNKWILPKYGKFRIKEITVKHVQKILNQWAKMTDQYKVLHSTVSRIFKYAMTLGLITKNPCELVIMPNRNIEKKKDTVKIYSRSQLEILFQYLESKRSTYRADYDKTLLRFLFFSGCRISEALALNWSDIDFDSNTVTINKTLSQTKYGYKISSPKTKNSYGSLSLDNKTINWLKKWQINQKRYMLTLGITDPTMIFCGLYKEIITKHAIYSRMITICKNSGIPFLGNHVTRHTHASMLLESGVSMKEVQERLRHSSIKLTMDTYAHLTKETKEKTVEKLAEHLNF